MAVSETLAGQDSYRRLLDLGAADIVLADVSWCGGIAEAKQIAHMAAGRQLPIALHDCTGPVVLATSVHLSVHLPNAMIQESVRAYYRGWYPELATGLPTIADRLRCCQSLLTIFLAWPSIWSTEPYTANVSR